MKILILFAHPAFQKSQVNQYMVAGLSNLKDVTFRHLYEEYPDFDIDVEAEQKLLTEHDCIVFQFPFFWYSTPAILKEWQDLVLQHGWAYGSKGITLKDKLFFITVSVGASEKDYHENEFHNHTVGELLAPLHQMASLCKMQQLPPFVIHGTNNMKPENLRRYKSDYLAMLKLISEGKLPSIKKENSEYLNNYIL